MILRCPVCQSTITYFETTLQCENSHSFDRAKQGYYNLLLNSHKKSKQPGDNAQMVNARTQFLDRGYYQSISDAINQMAVEQLWKTQHAQVIDLGCGEGYYTERLNNALADHQVSCEIFGLDISKDAVKSASKRNKEITWLVANGVKPPFEEKQSHLLLNIFNRIMPENLHSLCHNDGHVVIASAGAFHLQQLKEAIYETPKFKEFDCKTSMMPWFNHQHRTQLDYTISLDSKGIEALLGMTPHVWRSSAETQSSLLSQDKMELRVQVNLDWFNPNPYST